MAQITTLELKHKLADRQVKQPAGYKLIWAFPWLYRESILMGLGLLLIGLALEVATGGTGASALQYPFNVAFGAGFLLVSVLLKVVFKKHPLIKWLGSVPASLSAIGFVFLMVVLLGLIPQVEGPEVNKWLKLFGLTHITSSWPFILALLYLLATLQFAIFKRVYPLTLKNVAFFINHAGLWIAIFGGFLGTGDFKRLTMDLYQDETVWQALDENRNTIDMPIALKLTKFDIEEYNPKLALFEHATGNMAPVTGSTHFVLEAGNTGQLGNWQVTVDKFYAAAVKNGGTYENLNEFGAAPAAFIKAVNTVTGQELQSWVSCGSFITSPEILKLDEAFSMAMTMPEPKRFSSEAILYTENGHIEPITLEVNKPYNIGGWKMYQTSYDDRFGRWSQLSVIELIHDPWLPVVYTGIFMMIAGAVYMLWAGKEIKQ